MNLIPSIIQKSHVYIARLQGADPGPGDPGHRPELPWNGARKSWFEANSYQQLIAVITCSSEEGTKSCHDCHDFLPGLHLFPGSAIARLLEAR